MHEIIFKTLSKFPIPGFIYEILFMSYNLPILNICYAAGKVQFGILCCKLEQYHLFVMS